MQNPFRRIFAVLILLALGITLTACDDINKSGYSASQKEQIAQVVRPEAIKLTTAILRRNLDRVGPSDDGKSFLVGEDVNSDTGTYSVLIEIAKTGDTPDPTQVTSIYLYHSVPDPSDPSKIAIDHSLNISSDGDHINTDKYWAVDTLTCLTPKCKGNDEIFLSNLPVYGFGSSKINMADVLDTTKLIMDHVRTMYEPALLGNTK